MPRPGVSRALAVAALLIGAALVLVVLAAIRLLPAKDPVVAGIGWLPPALAGVAAGMAALLATAGLGVGLYTRRLAALGVAGWAAAVAGGALAFVLASDDGGLVTALPLAAGFLLFAVATGDRTVPGRRSAVVAGAAGLILVEAAVVAGILPAIGPSIDVARIPLLIAAAVVASPAIGAAERWLGATAAATAVAAIALALARSDGIEGLIGLAALAGGSVFGLTGIRITAEPRPAPVAAPLLPSLAHHLPDAVLAFDGGLRLHDWNAAAGALLGIDRGSRGTRLEDLLGVSMADLPALDGAMTRTTVVGGLGIHLHRAGDGLIAIVGDRRSPADEDGLGRELRGTIEELLQARRTIELQRAEIERSSTVDLLTGVASRGAILDRLRVEIAQARRYRHPVAVALLDVDGLGRINDRHGVGGGDAALREVALRMRLRVREADALGRSGSDGFLAVLPHTDEAGATTFAAALQHRLGQRPVPLGDELLTLTVSVGVAVMRSGEDLDLDDLLARVERALDTARSSGGGRISTDRENGVVGLPPDGEAKPDEDRTAT